MQLSPQQQYSWWLQILTCTTTASRLQLSWTLTSQQPCLRVLCEARSPCPLRILSFNSRHHGPMPPCIKNILEDRRDLIQRVFLYTDDGRTDHRTNLETVVASLVAVFMAELNLCQLVPAALLPWPELHKPNRKSVFWRKYVHTECITPPRHFGSR